MIYFEIIISDYNQFYITMSLTGSSINRETVSRLSDQENSMLYKAGNYNV